MIQDIGKGRYRNEYTPTKPLPDSRVLCCRGNEALVRLKDKKVSFLTYQETVENAKGFAGAYTYLFSIDKVSYFLIQGLEASMFPGSSWQRPDIFRSTAYRTEAFAGITGMQLAAWYESRCFCPRCGRPMRHDNAERMMRCDFCGQMEYPKISPAVIVGVTNGDRLLLTRYAGRSYKRFALVAGFTEIGETAEETVEREVMEEVGLKVKNICYYKSQPWSFTGTLLMGFFAEVDGDATIRLDRSELSAAEWHTGDEIPEDDGISLTREMMRVFREGRLLQRK